jgi:hypothetical protein
MNATEQANGSSKSGASREGTTMSKHMRNAIAGVMTDYHMGKDGSETKAKVIARLSRVVGSRAEAVRVYDAIMR